jgi:hypothetical protein
MATISGVSGLLFWFFVRKLDKEEAGLDALKQGRFGEQNGGIEKG